MGARSQDSRARLVTGLVSDRRKDCLRGAGGRSSGALDRQCRWQWCSACAGGLAWSESRGGRELVALAGQTGRKKSPERAAGGFTIL